MYAQLQLYRCDDAFQKREEIGKETIQNPNGPMLTKNKLETERGRDVIFSAYIEPHLNLIKEIWSEENSEQYSRRLQGNFFLLRSLKLRLY